MIEEFSLLLSGILLQQVSFQKNVSNKYEHYSCITKRMSQTIFDAYDQFYYHGCEDYLTTKNYIIGDRISNICIRKRVMLKNSRIILNYTLIIVKKVDTECIAFLFSFTLLMDHISLSIIYSWNLFLIFSNIACDVDIIV